MADKVEFPTAPKIEGYLHKLKRKTNLLTGSWNKRWFFVDPMRRELCYSNGHKEKVVSASIRLDDILSIKSFDDLNFQIESKARNFFLRGDSQAYTAGWVRTLGTYHKQRLAFEKQKRDDAFKASLTRSLPPEEKACEKKKRKSRINGGRRKSSSHDYNNDSKESIRDSTVVKRKEKRASGENWTSQISSDEEEYSARK